MSRLHDYEPVESDPEDPTLPPCGVCDQEASHADHATVRSVMVNYSIAVRLALRVMDDMPGVAQAALRGARQAHENARKGWME